MLPAPDEPPDETDDLDEILDDQDARDEPEDAAALGAEAEVTCPHCGETQTIALDPAGGRTQEYVEDCAVCCRPWRVQVWYNPTAGGAADVHLLPTE